MLSTCLSSATGNKAAWYTLYGIQKDTSGSWVLNTSFIGDNLGITFSINTSGQILYTTTNDSGYISNILKFEAHTTSVA
jgi:hypothetical protein